MGELLNLILRGVWLAFGVVSVLIVCANAYFLIRHFFAQLAYKRQLREEAEERKRRPPPVEPTPEECARRHQELLDAGFTYDSCYGAYTKPARPDWEH